jgi:4-amino-4-deoxy-L-arabinose transferase-like glycosyltransferase
LFSTDRARPGLLAALATILIGLPSLALPLGRDHGEMLYAADVLLSGGALYRDVVFIRPPGIVYALALGVAAFGKSGLAFRLFDLCWQAATAAAIAGLGGRLYGRVAAATSGVLYALVYYVGHDYWSQGNGDAFIALPAALALWALVCDRKRRLLFDGAAGALLGFVFQLRYTHGLIVLSAAAVVLAAGGFTSPYGLKRRVARLLAAAAGFLLALAAFLIHTAATGAWPTFVYTVFTFVPKYAVTANPESWNAFASRAAEILAHFSWKYALPVWPGLAGLAILATRKESDRGALLATWLAAAAANVIVMGKFFAYHWLPLFPPLCLGAGILADAALRAARERRAAAAAVAAAVCVAAVVGFSARFSPRWAEDSVAALDVAVGAVSPDDHLRAFAEKGDAERGVRANYEAARYVAARTSPEDRVFVWGIEGLIYHLAGRLAPTRFYSHYAVVSRWRPQEWVDELMRDVTERPPLYVLIMTDDALPWVTGIGLDSLGILRRDFADLFAFIKESYTVESKIGNVVVCRRKVPTENAEPASP